jgi:phosphoribosyl 1,2-cyclic phosphate phosphodiesterase
VRFTFLGTGTSAGIPCLGCDCATCNSTDPRDNRTRTSGMVQWTDATGQERVVMIDAGPDLRQQALRHRLQRLDAILFTHNHVDHTFGLDEVRRFNITMDGPIEVFAETHTLAHLRRVYAHIFDRQSNIQDSFVATLIAHELDPSRTLDLWGMRFTPIRLLHGHLPVLGYRIEPVSHALAPAADPANPWWPMAYCTDVSGIPPESWAPLEGVRTLVLDALRHRKHPTHFTLGQAVGVAHRIDAAQTYFVHMAHDLPHEQTQAELPEGMSLAWDGLVLGS